MFLSDAHQPEERPFPPYLSLSVTKFENQILKCLYQNIAQECTSEIHFRNMCVAQQCLRLNSVILLKVLSHVALFKKPCPGDHFVLWKKFNSDHSIPFSLSASVVYN